MTFTEAQRAIYIDFECLKRTAPKTPHPAVLGVLVGSEGESLEQLIVDERLAPARVASKRCRVAEMPAAVNELLDRANRESRTIAGWSYFDRHRLIDAAPDRAAEIKARYVNALHVARPWRKSIHPAFPIEKEDQFAAKHTLDKYAVLSGYAPSKNLVGARPVQWIRDTIKRVQKVGGGYRGNSTTKRDWHKLLEYNRHDCLALRHIVLRASRELECWRAYQRTEFCVDDARRRICFTIGSKSRKVEALLARHRAQTWAFITAWNPASVQLTRAENDARQRALTTLLHSEGYRWLEGEGVGEDPAWEPERSVLILDVSVGKAIALGRQFGQLAIVVGRCSEQARLVACTPTPQLSK